MQHDPSPRATEQPDRRWHRRHRRHRARAATALLGAAAALLTTTPPAAADAPVDVPGDGVVRVVGHGYGHGHGMSQYGAQGAARQGLDWQDIVSFYYPGTELRTRKAWVRVLLSVDPGRSVVVRPTPGLRVTDLSDRTSHELPERDGTTAWRLRGIGETTVVARQVDGRWKRWRPEGRTKPVLLGDGQFRARGPLTLVTPTGERRYRGGLRAASPSPGDSDRDTVNVVRMEGYVKGVVAREMPASWHPEAVRAQSVAARTYAMRSRQDRIRGWYQLCDTTSCQVYGGMDAEDPRSNAAVRATRHQVLVHGGRPALTQFHSSSGGRTFSGGLPYLAEQDDPYDDWSGNPMHRWTRSVDLGPLAARYGLGELVRVRVLSRQGGGEWGGEVTRLRLVGTKARRDLSGNDARWALGLRSAWFTVETPPSPEPRRPRTRDRRTG